MNASRVRDSMAEMPSMPSNLIPVAGILRSWYGYTRLGLGLNTTQISRCEWLGLDDRALDAAADDFVFKEGMSLYGYEGNLGDLPQNYEELRDFYCRCEIAARQGWDYAAQHKEPFGFRQWYPSFYRQLQIRLSQRSGERQ